MRKSLFIGLVAVLGLISCSRNQEVDVPDANLALFARTESPADTKTVVESGVHVFWEPGDEIAVFMGEQSAKFTTDITAASGTATFKGTFGDATWPEDLDLWAVYPFSEDAVFDGETITTTLPSEQIAREGSFGKDMNLSIAHSNSSTLQFYNVGGGIRFSVTEEGIKKVMFEGLSGEVISGKVKIGFEDAFPVVKEVTGGSQFITLLPPSGQDTFEPGAWYYIVAIPGSLEGGYKLRFYKDEDYARKVSEKSVMIKRSIFGNIEKADEGVEFEPQTTHFPETKEEWEVSAASTSEIFNSVSSIIGEKTDREIADEIETVISEIQKIEGVKVVEINDSHSVLSIRQNDDVWINYFLKSSYSIDNGFEPEENVTDNASRLMSISPQNRISATNKKALFLSPFQTEWDSDLDKRKKWLEQIAFDVKIKPDSQADIYSFMGDALEGYDLIFINTHGGLLHKAFSEEGEVVTTYASATEYNASWAVQNLATKTIPPDCFAIGTEENKTFVCMTPDALDGCHFNNTCIITSACKSLAISEGEASMAQAFIDHGASVYCGFTDSINRRIAELMTKYMLLFLCEGVSFQNSAAYWLNSPYMISYCDATRDYLMKKKEDVSFVNQRLFGIKQSESANPYYLVDATPSLLVPEPNHDDIFLRWDCIIHPEVIHDGWKDDDGNILYQNILRFNVFYDLFIDDNKVISTLYDEYGYTPTTYDSHSWQVTANFHEDNTGIIIASFQSGIGDFTVKEQKPDPPQVETFPASVDAQKAFLSGMVTNRSLEGLETGFYYYKLTAQEESTELSASEKERLVMGGKKVLSAGDYKDYFGIDLTDIEQDSKYLFVAYATDEYSQTGKGEVLSFTTGSPSVHVSSVSLNMSSLELGVGNTATLIATVLPENASNKKVTWSSSDESKATVSSQGVVKGISMGNAVITVTTEDGGKKAQCNVSVTQSTVHVQSVSLNMTDLVLTVGNSETLVATVLPENASNKSVTWSSSNPSKATVSSTGVVTGVAEGAAVVTATTVDGGKTASCFVTVRQATQPDPGESGNALIELSCAELDWGDVEIGNNVTKTFTVKNTGTTALNISSVSIVATDNTVNPSYFSILPNSSSTVSPGNSLAFNVTFIPEAECGYYAIVYIKSNAGNATQGTSMVWLTGVGIKASSSHSVETPEIVDLGLSVKWASFNLGASKPEEFGDYYAWGETEPYYSSQNPLTWKEGKESGYAWSSYNWCMGSEDTMTKYCSFSPFGYNKFTDTKTLLDTEDDVAHVKLGDKWRMPTDAEFTELRDRCTWEWTSMNGIIGRKVTGPNGNSIFLPSAGSGYGTKVGIAGSNGLYWSSSLETGLPCYAWGIDFDSDIVYRRSDDRYVGRSVRPVTE